MKYNWFWAKKTIKIAFDKIILASVYFSLISLKIGVKIEWGLIESNGVETVHLPAAPSHPRYSLP